jgi:hypothetical protein
LLATVELALPTDSRSSAFSSGTTARVALTAERYWDRVGLIAEASSIYEVDDRAVSVDFAGGVGLQMSEALNASFMLGGETRAFRAELIAEYLIDDNKSLEIFGGHDLNGEARAAFFGLALNLWLSPGRR